MIEVEMDERLTSILGFKRAIEIKSCTCRAIEKRENLAGRKAIKEQVRREELPKVVLVGACQYAFETMKRVR